MSAKMTLEEIEELAKGAVSNDWDVYAGEVRAFAMSEMLDMAVSVECDSEEKAPTLALIASAPRLLEIAQEMRADLEAAEAAMRDMLAGWRQIREGGGEDEIYGIGWDRAQKAVEDALTRIGTKK